MGADNLRSFHRWQKWRKIVELVPIVVIDRLGPSLYASASPAGNALARLRIHEYSAPSLADRKAPVWTFLHGLKSPLSSTALRALRGRGNPSSALTRPGKSKRSKPSNKKRGKKITKRKKPAKTRQRRTRKKRAS
jgi:nicotinate-nucleotide adenylyltransferase